MRCVSVGKIGMDRGGYRNDWRRFRKCGLNAPSGGFGVCEKVGTPVLVLVFPFDP